MTPNIECLSSQQKGLANNTMNTATTTLKVKFSQVAKLIRVAFPEATTRKECEIIAQESFFVRDFWDGGTRFYSCGILYPEMSSVYISALPGFVKQEIGNPFKLMLGNLPVTPDFLVVEHPFFGGKDKNYRIYVHPSVVAELCQKLKIQMSW